MTVPQDPIVVLHVDDDSHIRDLVSSYFQNRHEQLRVHTVDGGHAALEELDEGVDCVVSDYDMPAMNGLELLEAVRERRPELPFILLTGMGSEDVASDAISAGVTDYFQKSSTLGDLSVLARRVRNAVTRHRAEVSYRELFEKAAEGFSLHDPDTGAFVDVNASLVSLLGIERVELLEMTLDDVTTPPIAGEPEPAPSLLEQLRGTIDTGPTLVEASYRRPDEQHRWIEIQFTPIQVRGRDLVLAQMRDVTERKRYEQTLSALHASVTELVGADRAHQVAAQVVATAEDILAVDRAAVYLYSRADNCLELADATDRDPEGSTDPTVPLDPERPVAEAFIEGAPVEHAPASDAERERTLLVPIDDRGVLGISKRSARSKTGHAAGEARTDDRGSSPVERDNRAYRERDNRAYRERDDRAYVESDDREYAEILASAAAAALDRIRKDREINSTREELSRQTAELDRLRHVNGTLRALNSTLLRARTREEVYEATCANLSDIEGITLAWIGVADGDSLERAAWAGSIPQYLDSVDLDLDSSREPAVRAARTGSTVRVDAIAADLGAEPWRRRALAHGVESVLALPLETEGITYGVLSVLGDDRIRFDDRFEEMLAAIALSVSETINSIEQRQSLESPSSTELTFELTDDEYLFQRLAADATCEIEFVGAVTESAGRCRAFVRVKSLEDDSAVDVDRVREIASSTSTVERASVVSTTEDGGRLELLLATPVLGVHFSEHVVAVTGLQATPESVAVSLLVARPESVPDVGATIRERYPNARLVSKRPRTEVDTDHQRLEAFWDALTPRQREVVRTAYLSGYFDTPRRCTGDELGEKLGISSQAVYQHIRSAQRKLLDEAFQRHGTSQSSEQ